jgi:hypothetical protein
MPRIAKPAAIEVAIELLRLIADDDAETAYKLAHSQTPDVLDQVSEGLMFVAAACRLAYDSKVAEQ